MANSTNDRDRSSRPADPALLGDYGDVAIRWVGAVWAVSVSTAVDRGGSPALVLRRRGRGIIGQLRTHESYLSPRGQMRIGQPDVDRADAEDGDHDGLFDAVKHTVIMEGPRGSLDITACRHRHRHIRP